MLQSIHIYIYAVSHVFIVDLHLLTQQIEAEEKKLRRKHVVSPDY